MKYKQIYIEEIEDEDELNRELKKNYGFSLLNFAYVIADVLAEVSVFSKMPHGRKISDIKREIQDLYKIKKKFYNSEFKQNPLSRLLDEHIKNLEDIVNAYEKKPDLTLLPWPEINIYSRSFSLTNQIAFLWSPAMRGRSGVHWANICNVIYWFLEELKGSIYKSKLYFLRKRYKAKSGYPKVLKNQYQKIKLQYFLPIIISSTCIYFPFKGFHPLFLKGTDIDLNNPLRSGWPINSIKFYKNKIKTIFNVSPGKRNNNLKVSETVFRKNKPTSEIRDYHQEEENIETDKLLLDIS